MVSKKFWDGVTTRFVNLLRQVTEKQSVEILDASFEVLPNVFSPVYSSDTAWFARQITPLVKGKKFLEIGSGSGVIACLASMRGASPVVATDINPTAVNNIRLNAWLHSLDISIRKGNMFDPIGKDELFDIIFWNHPFNYTSEELKKNDELSRSTFDTNYQYLSDFFRRGRNHLVKNGQLLLGTSNITRVRLIKKMAQNEGYILTLLEKEQIPVYKETQIKMDLRIYSLKSEITSN